jgi:hypothetical protein
VNVDDSLIVARLRPLLRLKYHRGILNENSSMSRGGGLLALALFVGRPTSGLQPATVRPHRHRSFSPLLQGVPENEGLLKIYAEEIGRRQFFHGLGAVGLGLVSMCGAASATRAGTVIDIQRYGDKELKIALINKVKQLMRNELLNDPTQSVDWLKLALSDSLSYDASTDEGGATGAVQHDRALLEGNQRLRKAVETLKGVQQQLTKTTEVSLADVIAYAGAEAIEASGGPRIQVQIGRYDAPAVAGQGHVTWVESDLPLRLKLAFEASGLGTKDRVLLLGALSSVERAAQGAASGRATAKKKNASNGGNEGDDDDESALFPSDGGAFIPQTFGTQKSMFGDLMSSAPFDASVFRDLSVGTGSGSLLSALLPVSDARAREVVAQYAPKGGAKKGDTLFRKDLVSCYRRLTVAGATLTGAKVLSP